MENISSLENQKIKKLKKLSLKKYREQYALFLVENFVILKDALESGEEPEEVYLTKIFITKDADKYEYIKERVDENKIYVIDTKINKHVSSLDTPSGLVAVFGISEKKVNTEKSVIYLNGVSDPGNLGTILRTCVAFGFENIVCDAKCADIYNPKTISASKDSIFKVRVEKDNDLNFLKTTFMPIYVSDVSVGEKISNFSFPEKYVLVFGSESHGVDKEVTALAQNKLNIQISEKIESLNVSSAVSIFLYEIRK
ncbi:hypothetical protein C0584_00425 [Candidatus Parcubacteria bacterium]|nr:MAG: hypothetical protein C0584_00425 [Candidatus Parcubacteria bacterium]